MKNEGFNVFYDALGGGDVTNTIISHLPPQSRYYLYGTLEKQPLTLEHGGILFTGLIMTSFYVYAWWTASSEEVKDKIRK